MGLWKDKVRKDWCYKFQYLGQEYGSRGFKTRRDAAANREKRREEVKDQTKATPTGMAFSEAANQYLDNAKRRYVKNVYLRKVNVCKRFMASQGDLPVDQIAPSHIHDYLKSLPTSSTYNEHRDELSSLFTWTKRIYAKEFPFLINPCVGVDRMTHVSAEKQIPTEEEIIRMIIAATPGEERDILLTCIQTLGRIDEVLRLRWLEDVNFEKRFVVLWTRKRKNGAYESDVLPMNQDLYDVLWDRWKKRTQDKWVFFNEQTQARYQKRPKMMASICRRAGLKPLGTTKRKIGRGKQKGQYKEVGVYYGFHALRHFMASYLLDEKKVSLKTVSELLRHRNVRTTEIYLHAISQSKLIALDNLEGKFTLKLAYPPPTPATKIEEGVSHYS